MCGLAEAVGAEIRPQHLGNEDGAVGLLVVLENAGDRAREREAGTVQRVHEARLFALRRPEANVRAARLEVGEGAAGADLEPRADSGGPRLEVVGLRTRE